jgi:hypothetical protein
MVAAPLYVFRAPVGRPVKPVVSGRLCLVEAWISDEGQELGELIISHELVEDVEGGGA